MSPALAAGPDADLGTSSPSRGRTQDMDTVWPGLIATGWTLVRAGGGGAFAPQGLQLDRKQLCPFLCTQGVALPGWCLQGSLFLPAHA